MSATPDYDRAHRIALPAEGFEHRIAAVESARQWLGNIGPGFVLTGVSKGQFSALDLLIAVLQQTGRADVVLSTWTAAINDVADVRWFIDATNGIDSLWWFLDRSFATRQPGYCAALVELYGPDCIRATNSHAKFFTVRGDDLAVSALTSANLNRNKRLEHYTVFVEPADASPTCDFYEGLVAEFEAVTPPGPAPDGAVVEDVFSRALAGATCGDIPLAEMGEVERLSRLGYTRPEIRARQACAGDEYATGAWALEDTHRQSVLLAAEGGDARARDIVAGWISAQRRAL